MFGNAGGNNGSLNCVQAFGAKHHKIVGTVYQRALLICCIFYLLFVMPVWLNMGCFNAFICRRRTLSAFKGWGQYMRLALPCVAMIAVEAVAFQGLIIMAGYLAAPDRNVAAMGITFNLCGLAFMVSYGIAGLQGYLC